MAKRERLWHPKPHRAVEYNERAIQKVIDECGYVAVSAKLDGIRALISRVGDTVRITTREGIEIRSLALIGRRIRAEFDDKLPESEGIVADCEVYLENVPFDESSGILRRNAPLSDEQVQALRIAVFDVTFEDAVLGARVDSAGLDERLARFWGAVLHSDILQYHPHRRVYAIADLDRWFRYYHEDCGMEGLVIKDPRLPYRNGKVSGWWKMKPEITEDGIVTGYVWGEEGKANAGKVVGFEVKLESGETVRATGLTREAMDEYTKAALTIPYGGKHPAMIGRYCEVKAMERTTSGKLRHPHFKCWRDMEGAEGVKA